jgi:uncharacterized phosphosugar-binding protein
LAIETALGVKARGATLIDSAHMVYEPDHRIVLQHPGGQRLHEIIDFMIDLSGSYGDGERDVIEPGLWIVPSSGVTVMVALWMIYVDATEQLIAQVSRCRSSGEVSWSQVRSIAIPGSANTISRPVVSTCRLT